MAQRNFRAGYLHTLGFKSSEHSDVLEAILHQRTVDLARLKNHCCSFLVPSSSRGLTWKLLLGYIPPTSDAWGFVSEQRQAAFSDLEHAVRLVQGQSKGGCTCVARIASVSVFGGAEFLLKREPSSPVTSPASPQGSPSGLAEKLRLRRTRSVSEHQSGCWIVQIWSAQQSYFEEPLSASQTLNTALLYEVAAVFGELYAERCEAYWLFSRFAQWIASVSANRASFASAVSAVLRHEDAELAAQFAAQSVDIATVFLFFLHSGLVLQLSRSAACHLWDRALSLSPMLIVCASVVLLRQVRSELVHATSLALAIETLAQREFNTTSPESLGAKAMMLYTTHLREFSAIEAGLHWH